MILRNRKPWIVAGTAIVLVGLLAVVFLSQPNEISNKLARRAVKTATDPAASHIVLEPQNTTIGELIAHRAPETLAERVEPFESTVWQLSGTVETIELKKDGDFYMVIRDENGDSTVVEVPDPETCKGSPVEDQVRQTRQALENQFHPTPEKKEVNQSATISGVGFYGWGGNNKKGSGGYSGPRLMPGTSINFD